MLQVDIEGSWKMNTLHVKWALKQGQWRAQLAVAAKQVMQAENDLGTRYAFMHLVDKHNWLVTQAWIPAPRSHTDCVPNTWFLVLYNETAEYTDSMIGVACQKRVIFWRGQFSGGAKKRGLMMNDTTTWTIYHRKTEHKSHTCLPHGNSRWVLCMNRWSHFLFVRGNNRYTRSVWWVTRD